MKNGATKVLQVVLVLLGIGALAFLLWEPHVEGRNAHATLFQVYFNDPFLAYAYVASIPFFVALYQAFQVLARVRQDGTLSQATVKPLRTIKVCAIALVGFVALGEVFLELSGDGERPQRVFMGLLVAIPSLVVAVTASKFEQNLQRAVQR